MTKYSFEEFREFLREVPKGQVLDSLFAVELGLDEYSTAWLAHQDMMEDEPELKKMDELPIDLVALPFLIDLGMFVNLDQINIEKLVSNAES